VLEWNVAPEIFAVGPFHVRWYGVLFGLAFLLSFVIMQRMFRKENKPAKDLDTLSIIVIVATLLGARLGHVQFYDWQFYSQGIVKVLAVWEGGLASHGAAIGIILAVALFQRLKKEYSFLWLLDRLAIVAAIGGALVRLGNLFNSEILGTPTTLPWGVWFQQRDVLVPIARHPSMVYESLMCLVLFVVLYRLYNKGVATSKPGFIIGLFFVVLFTFRFLVEFIKINQSDFESTMLLNMGQRLSVPFVLVGAWLLVRSQIQKARLE
jgi:phosphatidylglycerol---prolipoprotein diacylglyceryl transferase